MLLIQRKVIIITVIILLVTSIGSSAMGAIGITLPSSRLEIATPDYGLQASVNGDEVTLSWSSLTPPTGKQLRGYHVYRSTEELNLVNQTNQISEFAVVKTSFVDHTASGIYYYAVQATYSDGSKAAASQPLKVSTDTAVPSGGVTPRSNIQPSVQIPPLDISSPRFPTLPGGEIKIIDSIAIGPKNPDPIPVAFSAIANRYTGVDPATTFDLNGDLVGDLKISSTEVIGKNGTGVQVVDPPALNLDDVHLLPVAGYTETTPLQLSRVYVAKLSGSNYAKFMVLQASPKVTLWFMYGSETSSVLQADGANSRAALTWDAIPDAALGYHIYRYEINDNSYTVTQLNDFTVQDTTFTDNTAANRYYLYVVQAVKADGSRGLMSTVAPVHVTHQLRTLVIGLTNAPAKLGEVNISMPVLAEIKNGLMMIPASLLTHAGCKVTYEASTGKITLSRRLESVTYTVVLNVASPDYTWNSTAYKTDVPPYNNGNEVMVPLRLVSPALGLGVTFNSNDRTATIGWYE